MDFISEVYSSFQTAFWICSILCGVVVYLAAVYLVAQMIASVVGSRTFGERFERGGTSLLAVIGLYAGVWEFVTEFEHDGPFVPDMGRHAKVLSKGLLDTMMAGVILGTVTFLIFFFMGGSGRRSARPLL